MFFCKPSFQLFTAIALAVQVSRASATITAITFNDLVNPWTIDFSTVSPGPISGTDPYFMGAGIKEVSLLGSFTTGDTLNSGVNGNALCSNGGGAGTLSVVAPNGRMDSQNDGAGFEFKLAGNAKQFGFRFVDQINNPSTITFTFMKGGNAMASYDFTLTSFSNNLLYLESSQTFGEVMVTADGSSGGWCLDDISVGDKTCDAKCMGDPHFQVRLLGHFVAS